MKKVIYVAVVLALLTAGCGAAGNNASQFQGFRLTREASGGQGGGFGGFSGATETPTVPPATSTSLPPTSTWTPSPVPSPTANMFPVVTFTETANCRKGPSVAYYHVLAYDKGQTTKAAGRSEDNKWVMVQIPNGSDYCWVSASTIDVPTALTNLRLIPPQALPDDPLDFSITRVVCGDYNFVHFSWSNVLGVTGYRLYRGDELIANPTTGTTYWLDEPRNAKTYTYALQAVNDFGFSHTISVTVPGCQ